MGSATVLICNQALFHCGIKKKIEDFDNDTSEEAGACRTYFDTNRKRLLRKVPWPFATRRRNLVQAVNEDRAGYSYFYKVPNDLLKPQYIYPATQPGYVPPGFARSYFPFPTGYQLPRADQKYPFHIEASLNDDSQVICCDLPPVMVIAYTYDHQGFGNMPDYFTDALAWALAADICMPLSIKLDRQRWVEMHADLAWREAWVDAQTGEVEDRMPDSETITARL